jgi:xyloglucan-specific exo-beta-1,4-glucanase
VRAGNSNGAPQIAVSTDGGVSWNAHSGTDNTKNSGTLAYSADADTIVWSSGNAGVLRSQNQGTFTAVASVPSGAAIAADKRNNTVFYAGSGSAFYRSTDTGATFAKVASAFGSSSVTAVKDIAAHPATAGEVWVSTDAGLFRSTNYGATFAQVGAGSISKTEQIAFGKGSGSAWNMYAFGTGSAGAKLYASSDNGASWVDVQGSQGFGAIGANRVAGSGNVANQVYVGTNGRGVLYAQVSVPGGGGSSSPSSSAAPYSTTSSTASRTSSVRTTLTTSTVKTTQSSTKTSAAPTASTTALAQRYAQCGGASVSRFSV